MSSAGRAFALAAQGMLLFTAPLRAGYINLALTGTASQSSTFGGYAAPLAIDGNTDGVFSHLSVTSTGVDPAPFAWWQVDLGAASRIDRIVIWNRSDFPADLDAFHVTVLDGGLNQVFREDFSTYPNPSTTIDLPGGLTGQYVKVQLDKADRLQLAEVQVLQASVPEPATAALLAGALAGLRLLRGLRRRR